MIRINEYYKNKLSVKGKSYYEELLSGFDQLNDSICIKGINHSVNDLNKAFKALILDHPDFFWIDGYKGYLLSHSVGWIKINVGFFYDSKSEIEDLRTQAENWRNRVCSKIPKQADDYQKIWMLFDYLARQVTYGFSENKYSQTIIGCMQKGFHKSVCEGIAKSYKYLCDLVGIKCVIVTGDLFADGSWGAHGWNMVKYRGRWYHIDVTAELLPAKCHSKADTKHFLKTDKEMTDYRWNIEYSE